MGKRSYRSVKVKKVNWEKTEEAVRDDRVVFGVDVGKEKVVGALMSLSTEDVALRVEWQHPLETALVAERVAGLPVADLAVALEPSSTYGDPLRGLFEAKGVQVYRVSPKRSHNASEVLDGVPSWHDAKSATLVAHLHRIGVSHEWRMRSEMERELESRLRVLEMYDKQEHANLNRLEALLARHWPELPVVLDLDSATLVSLVEAYGTPDAVAADESGARALMRRVGRHFLSEAKIEGVLQVASGSIGVRAIPAEREAIQEIAREVIRCRMAGRQARAAVEALVEEHEPVQRLGAVVGKITAATLVSKVGDLREYESIRALEKALGLNLKERSSGKHQGQLKITKRGPGICRFYLYLAVLRLVHRDPIVAAWYRKKVARDGGIKKKAIIAVMRKLVGALWHVARGAEFDSRRLFNTAKLDIDGGAKKTKKVRITTSSMAEQAREVAVVEKVVAGSFVAAGSKVSAALRHLGS
jgi:transposase